MWTIGDVKRAGWSKVKKYFWAAYVVAILAGIFSGSAQFTESARNADSGESYLFYTMLWSLMLVAFVVFALLKVFVGNPLEVGGRRYFMESRSIGGSAGIGKTFWVFGSGHYLNVVKIMFLRDFYNALWYLLLIIPGIIKAYEYAMIPYILSENPEAGTKDVFALTKDMMMGSKFQYFCYELSFIGWCLLAIIGSGIVGVAIAPFASYLVLFVLSFALMMLVGPYEMASEAEIYSALRRRVSGFPFNGYGVPEVEDGYEQMNGGAAGQDMPWQGASADSGGPDDEDRDFY